MIHENFLNGLPLINGFFPPHRPQCARKHVLRDEATTGNKTEKSQSRIWIGL